MKNNNLGKIIKYFFLWIVFAVIAVKIKEYLLGLIAKSSFRQISNPFFDFYEVHNTGAAFSLFPDKTNILILASVLCIIILTAIVLAKPSKLTKNMVSAMALLSAGMSLNTFERINYGYVTDYLHLKFLNGFPVFNLPDMMIVIGAFMLVTSIAFKSRTDK